METVDAGTADTRSAARAAATAALLMGAQTLGRQEFWVTVHEDALLVIPGLDDTGETDIAGLRDVLK